MAKIHIAATQLGMDEDTYREMLWNIAGVRTARDLDAAGRREVIKHLKACGWRPKRKTPYLGQPVNIDSKERGPQLRKIEALLAEAGRPWKYADGVARKICKVDKVQWCTPDQLRKVIAALIYDAKRHGRSLGRP